MKMGYVPGGDRVSRALCMIKEDLKKSFETSKRASDLLICYLVSFAEVVSLIYSTPS